MKQTTIFMLALCLLLASCGNGVQKSTEKEQIRTGQQKDEPKQTPEEIAHIHGCLTVKEFIDMRFSYVIEKNLPCLVYVEQFTVNDIVSTFPKQSFVFDPKVNIDVYVSLDTYDDRIDVGDCESEMGYDFPSVWCGEPSSRENECWLEGYFSSSIRDGFFCYLGIDKTQVDWIIRKSKEMKPYQRRIENTPIIIKIYQAKGGDGISVKADLVAILNEE